MRIPSLGAFLQPMAPTGDFPPVAFGTRSFGRWANRRMARLTGIGDRVYLSHINQVRDQLGLSPTTIRGYQRDRVDRWPILHGFSEYVLPRPADWHPGLEVTGYWWPAAASGWTPPAALTEFLAAGPAPIFIGLGSTATLQGPRLSETFTEVIRNAGVRAVVQSGWAGLDCDGPDILTVGDVPHEWLFPRMAAVVHHAGAGTTAAALRAGVPVVPVPGIMDQPFWAKRLVELGVAPGSIRRTHLDADRLTDRVTTALADDSYRFRAQEISQQLATEDGVGRAVESINRLLDRTRPGGIPAKS